MPVAIRVMVETVSSFLWSCALHAVSHTVNGVPVLVSRESKPHSPVASYKQSMSFFHLWRVFIHFRFSTASLSLVTLVSAAHFVE